MNRQVGQIVSHMPASGQVCRQADGWVLTPAGCAVSRQEGRQTGSRGLMYADTGMEVEVERNRYPGRQAGR